MRKLLLSIVAMLFCVYSYAQELPTIVPPSPEATSLAKFTEVPVSHYTGLPTISVPLYTIDFEGLKIPIGLSYHARGIRVEEIASRVGIGWALNAGGAITRQIRGKADDSPYGYLTKDFYATFEHSSTTRNDVYSNDVSGDADLIPDQFSFNFLGYSGKFIFDQATKDVVLQSYADIKIEDFGTSHFIITTDNGFKFYFGKPETANSAREAKDKDINLGNYSVNNDVLSSTAGTGDGPVSTWHLIDIVSPNGKKLSFNYTKEWSAFHRRSYDKRHNNTRSSVYSKSRGEHYQLSEIVFDGGKVKFNQSATKREDLPSYITYNLVKALASVEIENNAGFVKKYNLIHSYSYNSSNSNTNPYLLSDEPEAKKRLFLDGITLEGKNGSIQPYRIFSYNDKNSLPNRFSNSQDIWGYFNGKNNGKYLTFSNYDTTLTVDRSVDSAKAMVGLINKITYPTGGYSTYTFEPNKAIAPSYFKELLFQNPNPASIVDVKHVSMLNSSDVNITTGVYEKEFEVTADAVGDMRVYVSFSGTTCSPTQNIASCKYQVSIQGINGTSYYSSLYEGTNNSFSLPPVGDYKLVVNVVNSTPPPPGSNTGYAIALSWDIGALVPEGVVYSGGNRIKKTVLTSVDKGNITRTYEYKKTSGESSGLVYSLPSYYFIKKNINIGGVMTPAIDAMGARPGSPLTYEQGNHVGYSRVTEYIDSDTEIGKGGKVEYTFTAMSDTGEFYKPPYTLAINNEWMRGKPLTVKSYKKTSSGYQLVKQSSRAYSYAGDLSYLAILNPLLNLSTGTSGPVTVDLLHRDINRLQYNIPLISFKLNEYNAVHTSANDYKVYNLKGGVQKLVFSQDEYHYDNGNSLVNTTTYSYQFDKHYQTKETKVVDSSGKTILTRMIYPQDKSSLTAAEQKLDSLHIFTPIQTFSYLDHNGNSIGEMGEILNSQYTKYKDWGNNNVLPQIIKSAKGMLPLEDRIVFEDYYDNGKVQEVRKKDGSSIVYIWGYNEQLPIAKIENISFSTISTSLYNSVVTASNTDANNPTTTTESTLRTAMSSLRSSLPVTSLMTSYTYDPLIGVTSITDPRGRTVYYHYDAFNRLEQVKDHEGNILNKNEYNYKN